MFHTHAYFFWDGGDGVDLRSLGTFKFLDIRPRVDACHVSNPSQFRRAALHGLWYVYVMKDGTKHADSNYMPWRDYVPEAQWLVSLWNVRKLSHDKHKALSVVFRVCHLDRMRELAAVRMTEKVIQVRKHVEKEKEDLKSQPKTAYHTFAEIEEFVK